jgi:hypothetical protein
MWEFPHAPLEEDDAVDQAVARVASSLAGIGIGPAQELFTVRHSVTRFRIAMVCFEARRRAGSFRSAFYRQGLWLEPHQLGAYPVSAPQRKLANAISAGIRQRRLC